MKSQWCDPHFHLLAYLCGCAGWIPLFLIGSVPFPERYWVMALVWALSVTGSFVAIALTEAWETHQEPRQIWGPLTPTGQCIAWGHRSFSPLWCSNPKCPSYTHVNRAVAELAAIPVGTLLASPTIQPLPIQQLWVPYGQTKHEPGDIVAIDQQLYRVLSRWPKPTRYTKRDQNTTVETWCYGIQWYGVVGEPTWEDLALDAPPPTAEELLQGWIRAGRPGSIYADPKVLAGAYIERFGSTDKAIEYLDRHCNRCSPLLPPLPGRPEALKILLRTQQG